MVVTSIVAVGILTVVAVSLLGVGKENKDATVAIVTSAFGIVSTVVTAYLGIKATANTSAKASEGLAAALGESIGQGDDKPDPAHGGRGR